MFSDILNFYENLKNTHNSECSQSEVSESGLSGERRACAGAQSSQVTGERRACARAVTGDRDPYSWELPGPVKEEQALNKI